MTKKHKNIVKLFCLLIILLLPKLAFADDNEAIMKQVGFTYKINHPDNQIGTGGALNLKMTPGQEQDVTVTISNSSDQAVTLDLSLNGARTNNYGGLEYGPNQFEADKSMAYDITDLISMENEVVIPKQSDKELVLKLKMPKVPFDGIVTGGVQMIEKDGIKKPVTETGIVNKVAYLFGITLEMTDKEILPELDLKKVYPEQANFRNAIFLDIANIMPMKVQGLMLDVEIYQSGKTEVLYESKKNNMELAPNTLMSYPVSLGGERMTAGKYTAKILASAHDKEWKWEKEFTITREDADLFNQKDVNIIQERGLNWKVIVIIIFGLVFVMAGLYLVSKKMSRRKKNQKKASTSKRRKK